MKHFARAGRKFAVELFQYQVQENSGKNCISYPLGAEMALGMLLLGSGKATADEMKKALHFWTWPEMVTPTDGHHSGTECDKPGGFHNRFKQMLTVLNQHSKHNMLKTSGRLYGSSAEHFLEQYRKCVKEIYNSDLENVDFTNAAEEARQKINSWIERQTNGEIKNFFPLHSIDRSTAIILLNAASFQGNWKFPFNPKNTHSAVFWSCQDQSIYVDMMTQRGRFNIANISRPSIQVLEIPYGSDEINLYIILPEHETAEQIILNASFENVEEWINSGNMRSVEIKLSVPRFKIHMSNSMKSVFSKMGVKDLFVPGKADLSGMTGNSQAMVSHISQSISFTVNEEGVEAAGASRTEIVDGTHKEFKVNRDFLFILKHVKTESIMFMGRVCTPKWQEQPQ